MGLKQQALSGMIWTFTEQFGTQLISFGISIVLARLLLPSDFGTLALFGVVSGIAATLINGGMANSLIRTQKVTEQDLSTVFWFNVVLSILLYLVVFLMAPLIAQFFQTPILTQVIRIYSITLISDGFTIVQKTIFTKEMKFKTAFQIKIPALIIGGITGITLAWLGFGIWALVFPAIVNSLLLSAQYWFYSDWRPHWLFDKKKFHTHFNFGYKITLSGLLDIIFQNSYILLIGKFFSVGNLGYYSRADALKQLPVNNLAGALNKVTFPLFAKISHDDEKLRDIYRKLMRVVIFVITPVLGTMVVSAEPLIRFLMTEKWLPAVPYFQILSIAGLLYPIHAYNLNLLQVKGRSDLFFKLEVIKKIFTVVVILASLPFGIYGLLWGQVIGSALAFFMNSHYTDKLLSYSSAQQLRDLLPSILWGTFTAGILYLSDQYFLSPWTDLFRLLGIIVLYTALYLGGTIVFKFEEINFIKELIGK